MKTKAGTCCTSAFRVVGGTVTPRSTGGPNVVELRARPEMRDDNSSGAGPRFERQ